MREEQGRHLGDGHPAEALPAELSRPPGPPRHHVERGASPHPSEAEQVLVAVDQRVAVEDVVREGVKHEDLEGPGVALPVDEELPRLLLERVDERHPRELPDEAPGLDVEDAVARAPVVGPEDRPVGQHLGGVEEGGRVPERKVVGVEEEDLVEPASTRNRRDERERGGLDTCPSG